ncbi:NADH-flavin reductase-like protein [Hyaloraphidium curvatum]|nr:NADH-flavin reductase-like protein [Hyaloraphidium curvatum]
MAPKNLLVLGAAGNFGRHLAVGALDAGHAVSVLVRSPDKLPAEIRTRAKVLQADLAAASPEELAALMAGHDAVLCSAGNVTQGAEFNALIDNIASAAEQLPKGTPVWFLAGAALLDFDSGGRKGTDLPIVGTKFAPHAANLARLERSTLDWRLLCPGPMVDRPAVPQEGIRVSVDRLPVDLPWVGSYVGWLPGFAVLPLFARAIPEVTVPYANAAAVVLANLEPGGEMSRKRVGLALPPGMRMVKEGY